MGRGVSNINMSLVTTDCGPAIGFHSLCFKMNTVCSSSFTGPKMESSSNLKPNWWNMLERNVQSLKFWKCLHSKKSSQL